MNTRLKLTQRGWNVVAALGTAGLVGIYFLVGTLEVNL